MNRHRNAQEENPAHPTEVAAARSALVVHPTERAARAADAAAAGVVVVAVGGRR